MPAEIKSVSLSEDSTTVRIVSDNGHFDIASSEINALVMLLSQAEQRRIQKAKQNKNLKALHDVAWWNIGNAPDGSVVFSFQIAGGLEMSFRLNDAQVRAIQETLAVGLGLSTPSSPTSRH